MPLIQLIYVSSAVEEFSDDELDRILESSVRHNTPQAVTGMLLYSRGSFMQVLEGEEDAVEETWQRIGKDPRHFDIFLLSREIIEQKEFASWSMAFHRLGSDDAGRHPAYAPLFVNGFDAGAISAVDGTAAAMLKLFNKI